MSEPLVKVTLAILYREGQFLMQLRDDVPHIVHPGVWGFFGGHIEPGEDTAMGLRRELMEEIAYVPPQLTLFREAADSKIHRYYYYGELTVPTTELVLNEGQDLALFSVDEIVAGQKYSEKLAQVRSLGKPHQQALLTFLDSGLMPAGPAS
ncbi:MAG: NUDIX domain-containing protein [Phormidesmis sp. RL_2_1]|nr:NUDIX domain-containing protein [Phormidesmis sp. RL_2_1]